MDFAALEARTNTAVLAVFGEQVTLNGVPVQADFCEAYALGDVGAFGMASTQPTAVLASPLVPADVVGMPCVARSVSYRVGGAEPDGYGFTRLLLELP